MMRIVKILILLVFGTVLYSQNLEDKILSIVPPSVEHYNFVKQGNLSVNNNKGAFSHSIPLYTLEGKGISVPISLSYYNEGVKVNDLAGIAGMNWSVNAGGMITRIVRDAPDEYSSSATYRPALAEIIEIIGGNYSDAYYMANIKEKALSLYKSGIKTESVGDYFKVDNEQDWFNFNFNGISGSFYIENNQIKINSSIEGITGSVTKDSTYGPKILTFTFTMPDGTIYIFGGHSDFIETSRTTTNCGRSFDLPVASAWFLKEIKGQNNSIYFKYKNYWKTYILDYSETATLGNILQTFGMCSTVTSTFNECATYFSAPEAKTISEIYTGNSSIKFNYTNSREDYTGVFLQNIQVFDRIGKIKETKFDYFYSQSALENLPNRVANSTQIKKRLFLKEIESDGAQIFKFEYDSPDLLPARLSYKQDYSGYANLNEARSLLNIDDFGNDNFHKGLFRRYFSSWKISDANRKPNKRSAKYGSLIKIIYPSKGYTEIGYDNNLTMEMTPIISTKKIELKNEFLCLPRAQQYIKSEKFYGNGSKLIISNIITESLCPGVNTTITNNHNLKISNLTTGQVLYHVGSNTSTMFESNETIVTYPGSPTKFPPITTVEGNEYEITYTSSVRFIEGDHSLVVQYDSFLGDVLQEKNYSGVRVNSLNDYDGVKNETKHIYYNDYINKLNNTTSLSYSYQYNPWDISCMFYSCDDDPTVGGIENNCNNTVSFSSNNYYNSLNSRDEKIAYQYITTEREGNGAVTEKYKLNSFDNSPFGVLQGSPKGKIGSNRDHSSTGKVLEKYIYDSESNRKQEIIFTYESVIKDELINYIFDYNLFPYPNLAIMQLDRVYNNVLGSCNTLICNLQSKLNGDGYKNYIESNLLKKKKVTDFIDGDELQTTTEYFYNNPSHYQLTSQKTIFPDLSYQTTDYSYAHEKGKQLMIAANMIGIPLESVTTKGSKTISKVYTDYPDILPDTQTGNLLLPKSISSLDLVTGNSSIEITYSQYDNKGNIQQYTSKTGVPTAIIWGYNQTQPIAKIEGATYAQVSSLATEIINASNDDANDSVVGNPKENDLLTALDSFRNNSALTGYQITTFTYDPLIGVRSITPPLGIREIYIYDTTNRLKEVRDITGNILKSYEYHYKP